METPPFQSWIPLPPDIPLPEGTVDVCVGEGTGDSVALDGLSADELARARRFADHQAGARWGSARVFLRAVLGTYLGADPARLHLTAAANEKPRLGDPEHAWLRFNLSHSGRLALCAVARDREVGVDVEVSRRRVDELAIARRALGAAEAERLAELPPGERTREFLRIWTRYEAIAKCAGTGIGAARADEPAAGTNPSPWSREIELGPGMSGAVACESEPDAVRMWRWAGGRPP